MPSRNTNGGNIPAVIPRALLHSRLLCALLCVAPAWVSAASPAEQPAARVIIQWRAASSGPDAGPAATTRKVDALRSRTGRPLIRGWNIGGPLSVLQLDQPQSGARLAATLAALRADPEIELAVVDERVKAHAYTPSDSLYATQWYLQGTQPSAIRAHEAWDITRGAPAVVVAVLDSGVRFDHPDLQGKLLPGWDFVSTDVVGNDGDGWDDDPSDPGDYITAEDLTTSDFPPGKCGGGTGLDQPIESSWHGTRVAGIIAAASDNATGIAGAGFNVRILPVRVLGKCGGYVSDVIAGMYWAAGMAPPPPYLSAPLPPVNTTPARIINMSLGSEQSCTSSAVYRTAVEQVTAHGTLVVASTGNSGAAVGSPASCPGALAVAGLRHVGTKVGYSNLGPEVGIAAPAGNCVNIDPGQPCLFALNTTTNLGLQGPAANGYSSQTVQPTVGTSFSAPLAAGTAALMLSVNPDLSPAQMISLIRSTALPFATVSENTPQPPACVTPATQPLQSLECICNTAVCGAGMLDAMAAVEAAQLAPPSEPPADSGGGGSSGGLLGPVLLLWLARRRLRSVPASNNR
jgi:serine protease